MASIWSRPQCGKRSHVKYVAERFQTKVCDIKLMGDNTPIYHTHIYVHIWIYVYKFVVQQCISHIQKQKLFEIVLKDRNKGIFCVHSRTIPLITDIPSSDIP